MRTILAALSVVFWSISAQAVPMNYNFSFNADFSFLSGNSGDPGVPIGKAITGNVSLTLDPTLPATESGSGIILTGLTGITLSFPIWFSYQRPGDSFVMSGFEFVVGGVSSGTNNFALTIFDFTASPTFGELTFAQQGFANLTRSTIGTITILNITQVVETPLPGAVPLFVSGLGMLGFAAYRRTRKS